MTPAGMFAMAFGQMFLRADLAVFRIACECGDPFCVWPAPLEAAYRHGLTVPSGAEWRR